MKFNKNPNVTDFGFTPPAGYWISQNPTGSILTTLAGAADRIDLSPFRAAYDFTVDQLGLLCATGVASALAKIVVYSADANGRPDLLLLETGTLDLATAGFKSIAAAMMFAKGERYYLGVRHSSTATLNAEQIHTSPTLYFAQTPTTIPHKVLRRTLAFGTAAPSTWGFNAAEAAGSAPTSIFMRAA